jgi:hypothetical protein
MHTTKLLYKICLPDVSKHRLVTFLNRWCEYKFETLLEQYRSALFEKKGTESRSLQTFFSISSSSANLFLSG